MNGHQNFKSKITIIVLGFLLIITSCNNQQKKINCNEIEKIKIGYLPKGLMFPSRLEECGDIFGAYFLLKDTFITDRKLICEFSKLINELEPSKEEKSRDLRLLALIIYKNREITPTQLCMGESWTTVYDGVLMEDNPKLFDWMNKVLDWKEEEEILLE